jgi:hypothetical protein
MISKSLLIAIIATASSEIVSSTARADEQSTSAKLASSDGRADRQHGQHFYSLTLNYLSWNETTDFTNTSAHATATSAFYGNSLIADYEHYATVRYGFILQGGVLIGLANIGGSQSSPSYHLDGQKWSGLELGARGAYRLTRTITLSIGALALDRAINLPNDPSGTSATTSSAFNYGFTGDLRLRLSDHWLLKQELGSLLVKSSTFWSIGSGYIF